MTSNERQRKLEILGELKTCARNAALKVCEPDDDKSTFDALSLLMCAIDERIDDVENAD